MTSGLASLPEAQRQRASGRLDLCFGAGVAGEAPRLKTFLQSGSLRARLPRAQSPGWREVVTLNISGGIAGGDRLTTSIEVEADAKVVIAGQAAERVYRATMAAPALISTEIDVGPCGQLEYLPQESIFYDGFALERSLVINLGAGAQYLGVEMQAFGRRSMGETLKSGSWHDSLRLFRDGRLILNDRLRLQGAIEAQLTGPATADGAVALATLIMAGPSAAAYLDSLRVLITPEHVNAGASLVEGVLVARILARSLHDLRSIVMAALMHLREGRPLPRVWQG
ncbi:MAG: urease accessory protein UreD [Hyphomicrobiales bacterium]|nr:urease accessory protein UreD [Hyphomicrobiales bacterium]